MKKSKYITLLRAISVKERKEFEQFLKKLYSSQKKMILLFHYINKFAPDFLSDKLEKEIAIRKFYNQDGFSRKEYKNFLNTLSDLHKHLKDFLSWKTITQQPEEQDRLLMKIYKKNNLDGKYLASVERNYKESDQRKALSCTDFYHQMSLNDAIYFYPKVEKMFVKENHLNKAMQALDQFYVVRKLRYSCELWSRAELFDEQHAIYLINEVKAFQNEENFVMTPVHLVYYKILLLLKEKKYETYLALKSFLLHRREEITRKDRCVLVHHLLNHATSQISNGCEQFKQEAFDLYDLALQTEILLEKEYFTPVRFLNIIRIAIAVDELDWVKKFLKEYARYLPNNQKQTIVEWVHARVLFEEGNYQKSIQILLRIPMGNYFHSVNIRTLLLRNYYEEKEDYELIMRDINNFERFLSRTKHINAKIMLSYKNFLKFLKKLVLRKIEKEHLIREVKELHPIFQKEWILAKTETYCTWFSS